MGNLDIKCLAPLSIRVFAVFVFFSFRACSTPPKIRFWSDILDTKLGLDKLQFLLRTDEISISPDFPATIHSPRNAATGEELNTRLLYVAGGTPVTGQRAAFLTNNWQFVISPDRKSDVSFCSVQFSAGAFSKSNLEPLDSDQCFEVARAVEAELAEKGVKLDLSHAKLTRLDIAQNVRLSQPVACYGPALAAVGARKRVRKMDFGGTGFIVGNKSWEAGFYDKGAQMLELGYSPDQCPENTLRPEVRFMKARVIQDAVSCGSLPELRKNWGELKPAYKRFLKRDVFRPKIEANTDASIDFHQLARFVCEGESQRKWQAFQREGMPLFLVLSMGFERAKVYVSEEFEIDGTSDAGKKQLSRIFVQLEKADFALKMQAATTTGQEVKALYRELKRAVLSV